jgi:Kef-type K+ transport system membrane component KefB/nucleotide-binding universal stress UspA family protein
MMQATADTETNTLKIILAYGLMIIGVGIAYLVIRRYGEGLTASGAALAAKAQAGAAPTSTDVMLHVLLALIVVIVLARVLGTLFRSVHQPPVIGEIIAGIVLGPSVLGRVAPGVAAYLLPISVAPFLNVIAQIGVILYMFLVGLELDPKLLRNRGHATVAISHASILAPFLMGAALALILFPNLAPGNVSFTSFSLFIAVSMSITAFPVLARILTDRGIHKTRMGAIALTCAAVDDVTAWCLLALVVSVVESHTSGAVSTVVMALAFIVAMVVVGRPAMVRLTFLYGNRGLTQGLMAAIFVALLISAMTTDLIGIHAIFGAFALGAIIPHDSSLARELTDRLEDLVIVLLLPAFFAFTGLRTQIGLVNGLDQWLICALIIAVASIGKFGGAAIAARLTGMNWRDSSALGVLMNTRGLMELIVLNIGYDLKVIPPTLFAMLVIMALVTTFATTPILHFIAPKEEFLDNEDSETAPEPAAKLRLVRPLRQGMLVPISNPEKVGSLLDLALSATAADDSPPRVAAFVRRPLGGIRSGLREVEHRVVPRSQALSAALDYALEREAAIVPQATWTEAPARDIVRLATEIQAAWILMGFHRPVFGADFRGGVVGEVLERVAGLPINVGVVINAARDPVERISAVIDRSADGWAALDFATRVAQRRNCALEVVWVPSADNDNSELDEMLSAVWTRVPQINTIMLESRSATDLKEMTLSNLVVIGANLVAQLKFTDQLRSPGRCTIVVQGTSARLASPTISATGSAASG